jgi:RNA polymerase sigma-70 factor (ECF subfamily)
MPAVIIAKDTKSFSRGLVQLAPELRGRALRLSGNAATADDLVQDTIERALRFRAQYQVGTNLRAWVYQILFSVFVTRYRRTRREKNALRELAIDPNAWTSPRFDAGPSAFGLTPTTRHKLDAMPKAFRAVVEMVDLEERSYREAAERLGVPVGTVMSRLHRGRKMLAEQMREAA